GIEAALLDRARRPRQLRGPTELALDLLDELADLGGGGLRLFALDADERRLVLMIMEEDVENAVGQQRDADHRDKQHDVLGEQASAGFCDGGFCRRLLRRVSASGFRPFRGTPSLNEIENAHDEDGIKRWPTLSSLASRRRSLIQSHHAAPAAQLP